MVLKKLEIFNHQLQQYLTSSVTQLDKLFFKIGEVQDVDDHTFSNESLISYNTKITKIHILLDRVKKLCKKGVIYQILSGRTYKYLKK